MIRRLKTLDSRMLTILMIVFVQIVGASMVMPILPLYAQRQFDMSPEVITLLFSSFFAAQFLAGPYIGRLSDNYGRLPVLIVSQIGTVISFLMIAFAGSAELLLFARVLDGVTGGNIIVARAYVTDITPHNKRTQSLGYISAAFGVGFIIGPAAGGVLSALFGPQIPFIFAAGAATITVLLTWYTLTETITPEQRVINRASRNSSISPRQILRNQPLMLILAMTFGSRFGIGLLQSTFALYGEAVLFQSFDESLTALGVGTLMAGIGMGQIFCQLVLLPRLLPRFGDARLVLYGTVIQSIAMFFFAMITSPFLGFPVALMLSIGIGVLAPPLQSMITDTVAPEMRGAAMGLYQSAFSLSNIFSTMLGGVLFTILPTFPYWVSGVLFILLIGPALFLIRQFDAGKITMQPAPANGD